MRVTLTELESLRARALNAEARALASQRRAIRAELRGLGASEAALTAEQAGMSLAVARRAGVEPSGPPTLEINAAGGIDMVFPIAPPVPPAPPAVPEPRAAKKTRG